MSDFTVLELHFHDGPNVHTDLPGLPFGNRTAETRDGSGKQQPSRRGIESAGARSSSKLPIRGIAVAAVVILAIGAVIAVKLLGRDKVEDMADAFGD